MMIFVSLLIAVVIVVNLGNMALMLGEYPIISLMLGYHVGMAILIFWVLYFVYCIGNLTYLLVATVFGLIAMLICLALYFLMEVYT